MLTLTGRLVTVAEQKTKANKPFKRLQVMCNGQKNSVRVEVVKDYQNRDHSKELGKDISFNVFAFAWVGKKGIPAIDYVLE
jgi:hypothetical protein